MNPVLKVFMSLLLLMSGALILSADVSAAEVKYKSAMLRDPFIDPTDEKPLDDSVKVESTLRALQVQGVIISGENKSAIINGAIYKPGSKVGMGEVKDIDRDGVVVLYNGKEIKLQYIKRNLSNEKKVG